MEKYQEAEAERVELRAKFAQVFSEIEVQNSQYEARIEALQTEIHERTLEKERIREQLANNTDVRAGLLEELQKAEEKIAKHETIVAEMEKKFNEKEKKLISEMKQNESKLEELDVLKLMVADLKETNKKLDAELQEAKASSRSKIKQLEESLAHSESVRDAQLKAKMTLEGDNKRLVEQNNTLKEKLAKQELELRETTAKLEEAHRQTDEKVKEVQEQFENEKKALEIQVQRLQSVEQQLVQRVFLIIKAISNSFPFP